MSTRRRTYGLLSLLGDMKLLGQFNLTYTEGNSYGYEYSLDNTTFTPSSTGAILLISCNTFYDVSSKLSLLANAVSSALGSYCNVLTSDTSIPFVGGSDASGYVLLTVSPSGGSISLANKTYSSSVYSYITSSQPYYIFEVQSE